jgi:hypothetical protein
MLFLFLLPMFMPMNIYALYMLIKQCHIVFIFTTYVYAYEYLCTINSD